MRSSGRPRRCPERPGALFVGVLERYKDVDGLAAAWRLAAPRLPDEVTLRIVGTGSRTRRRRGARPRPSRPSRVDADSAERRDPAACSTTPRRSSCRRARKGSGGSSWRRSAAADRSSATRVGGITDLVRDGENGLLVEPRTTRPRSRTRSSACSRTASSPSASPQRRGRASSRGSRHPRTTRAARASSSSRCADEPPACPLRRAHPVPLPLAPGLERKWAAIEQRARRPRPRPRLQQVVTRRTRGSSSSAGRSTARCPSVSGGLSATFGRRRSWPRIRGRRALVIAARPGVPRDRRGARQLAALDAALRLAGASRALAARRPARRVRRAARRRRARALRLHRAGSSRTSRGRPPDAVFPTYSDLSAFTSCPVEPLPERPAALFVGVLEPYKNVDGLAEAWRLAAPQRPEATLDVVGQGLASGGRRPARRRRARDARARALARGRRRRSSTSRRCSCCLRATRASAAS